VTRRLRSYDRPPRWLYLTLALAAGLAWALTYALLSMAAGSWSLHDPAGPSYQGRDLPACDSDDGSGPLPCRWDSLQQGDGKGISFWVEDLGDQVHAFHYDEGYTVQVDMIEVLDD
jgi:hypothetical protein